MMFCALASPTSRPAPGAIPPPPRRVRRKFGSGCGINFLRIFILPHTVVGLALITAVPAAAYIRMIGRPVTATIEKVETKKNSKGRTTCHVYYHFTLDDRRYDKEDFFPQGAYVQPNRGDSIAGRAGVVFDHALFFGPGPYGGPNALVMAGFALFWNGVVGLFFYIAWIAPIRQRLLVKHGEAAAGVITGKQIIRGKSTSYRIDYTFKPPFAPKYADGHSGSCNVSKGAFDAAEVGAACTILFDPNKPQRNVAYEFCDFTASSGW